MYIVRWLMGHPIIATWVLGAIALLLTFGSGKKDQIDVQGDKPEVVLENQDGKTDAPAVILDSTEKQGVEKEDASKPEATDQNQTEEKLVFGNTEKDSTVAESVTNEASSLVSKKENLFEISEKSADENSNESDVKKEASQDASESSTLIPKSSEKPELSTATTTDLSQASTEELLQMAREAYWNNGLDEAAEIYQQLIELEPKVIEHRGELGNVLWRQGYPKKAAELYSEIAIPMIDSGNPERVANMVGFIGLFFPDRAAVIHQRIQATNGQ